MDNEIKSVESISENVIPDENSNLSNEGTPKSDTPMDDSNAGNDNVIKPEKRGDSLEFKLRRFKKQSSGIVAEVRKREAYEKPSVKRKKKSELARRKNNKYNKYGNYSKWQ